jgi:predicted nucleic acid-binding protein
VRFWDSSAVVPLLVGQESSTLAAAWVAEDAEMTLWTLTPVEVVSAFRRLVREQALREDSASLAERRLDQLIRTCHVVVDVPGVKRVATRLLRFHSLRAFGALQLGAALLWAEGHPEGRTVHTLDERLARAAEREGFVVPPFLLH